jgi:hypothetical protein
LLIHITVFLLAKKNVSAYILPTGRIDRWEVIMLLAFAAVLFAVFVVNVSIGSTGATPFFGNVGEMLLLFAVSIAFTAAVLGKEARRRTGK